MQSKIRYVNNQIKSNIIFSEKKKQLIGRLIFFFLGFLPLQERWNSCFQTAPSVFTSLLIGPELNQTKNIILGQVCSFIGMRWGDRVVYGVGSRALYEICYISQIYL